MSREAHVLLIAFPAQGHVAPLMKLGYKLADSGVKVTVVNTELVNEKIMANAKASEELMIPPVSLVCIPDGLGSEEDRQARFKLTESVVSSGPGYLEDLIRRINNGGEAPITCVIADTAVGWALQVARKMGIKQAAVALAGIANLAITLHAPKLIQDGIIDSHGMPQKEKFFSLSKGIPAWHTNELGWSCPGDEERQKSIFSHYIINAAETIETSNWVLTNSFFELESSAHDLIPGILSIGPLLASNHSKTFVGNFWPEELTSLAWLDEQPANSVIYVAFGSTGVINKQQLVEFALGLEITGMPFIWVVRSSNSTDGLAEFPDGFLDRVANRGKIVTWAAQEKVLAHPSVACFLSHCGWNSTMEGISFGVPFLCWPCYVDQFHNKRYICEAWKVGLGLVADESGIVTRLELNTKIEKLLSDGDIKSNSLKLKEIARKSVCDEVGSSFNNFTTFIQELKQ